MNTRYILSTAAVTLIVVGLAFLFAPSELLTFLGVASGPDLEVILQLLSGGFLGLGFVDWMSRGTTIGGIYGRPLLVGNQGCFTVGALVLIRAALGGDDSPLVWALLIPFPLLAVGFSFLFFRDPSAVTK